MILYPSRLKIPEAEHGKSCNAGRPRRGEAYSPYRLRYNNKIDHVPLPEERVGAYAFYRAPSEKELEAFDQAQSNPQVGINRVPFAVVSQVVAGTNLRFVLASSRVTNPPAELNEIGVVFVPLPHTNPKAEWTRKPTEFKSGDLLKTLFPIKSARKNGQSIQRR